MVREMDVVYNGKSLMVRLLLIVVFLM